MDPSTYWKLVAIAERAAKVRLEAKWTVARAEAAYADALHAAGLDPTKVYRYSDAEQTIVPAQESPG